MIILPRPISKALKLRRAKRLMGGSFFNPFLQQADFFLNFNQVQKKSKRASQQTFGTPFFDRALSTLLEKEISESCINNLYFVWFKIEDYKAFREVFESS